MSVTKYFYAAAHEQFPPEQLLRQAVAAEDAGFDGIGCSDHFQPWWDNGESGMAWVWLGSAAEATRKVPVGSAVTAPVHRYHPALVAQAWATLERMYPGRSFLGIGSGESLNESPLGMDWPSTGEQVQRMDEALEIINRLFDGETLDTIGHFPMKQARLWTLPERKPPIYVSAFGPEAAGVAARRADGLWTLADPEKVPDLIDVYKSAAEEAGRQPGKVILHTGFSWAEDDDQALEGARVWKGAQPDEFYTDDWHDPKAMYERGEQQMSDDEFKQAFIIGSDPEVHVERIREIEKLGADIVVLMNVSGADPMGAIGTYGDTVLPALQGARV
ncbi:MAG: TIGR03557 family F420-dependent LLM class oxidoreductase [Thermoleophilaceae bacterium]